MTRRGYKGHLSYLQQLCLSPVPGSFALKCEVQAELARAHKYQANVARQTADYQAGLEVCKKGAKSSEK